MEDLAVFQHQNIAPYNLKHSHSIIFKIYFKLLFIYLLLVLGYVPAWSDYSKTLCSVIYSANSVVTNITACFDIILSLSDNYTETNWPFGDQQYECARQAYLTASLLKMFAFPAGVVCLPGPWWYMLALWSLGNLSYTVTHIHELCIINKDFNKQIMYRNNICPAKSYLQPDWRSCPLWSFELVRTSLKQNQTEEAVLLPPTTNTKQGDTTSEAKGCRQSFFTVKLSDLHA